MKRSELKQLIKEVITELSPETLSRAANKKYQSGRGDRGEKLQQVAGDRRRQNIIVKIAKVLGVDYDPYNKDEDQKHELDNYRYLKGIMLYNGIGKLNDREFNAGIIDIDLENKRIQLTAESGVGLMYLFVKKNDDGKEIVVAREGLIDSPHLDGKHDRYIAFSNPSRMKIVKAFKNMGYNINPNNVLTY
jgi:hypothetical protein